MPDSARTARAVDDLLATAGARRLPPAEALRRLHQVLSEAGTITITIEHHPTNEATNVDDTQTRGS